MSFQTIQQIPTRNDSDKVWVTWYKDLRKTLGSKKANSLFNLNWSNQNAGNSDVNTTYLRGEMEKYGIDISGGFFGETLDFSRKAQSYLGDVFTTAKWMSLIVGGVVVVSVAALLYQLITKPSVRKEAVDIGATLGTRGLNKVGK